MLCIDQLHYLIGRQEDNRQRPVLYRFIFKFHANQMSGILTLLLCYEVPLYDVILFYIVNRETLRRNPERLDTG